VCLNWARTDLCGGREATRVPTAKNICSSRVFRILARKAFRDLYPANSSAPPPVPLRRTASQMFNGSYLPTPVPSTLVVHVRHPCKIQRTRFSSELPAVGRHKLALKIDVGLRRDERQCMLHDAKGLHVYDEPSR
jgi:hypothetical protein